MIKKFLCASSFVLALALTTAHAQTSLPEPTPTPVKVVITNSMPPARTIAAPTPKPVRDRIVAEETEDEGGPAESSEKPIVVGSAPREGITPVTNPQPVVPSTSTTAGALSFSHMKSRIAEAKRYMQSRPLATALSEGTVPTDYVRVAFEDRRTKALDYVVLSKESFLSTESDKTLTSQNGKQVRVRTIRGNGVNTPIVIFDETGQTQQPLLVQYPVVRNGQYMETAYYMSTHPGLVTPEVVNAGRYYVRNVIEIARDRLREKGVHIQPKVADIAERLAAVEHVDHDRFRKEPHQNIYNDVYTLFALNEGQTYRYSVSSAGAGGMVQMIPATYRMVRGWQPSVSLNPDFVEGMRNHVNATQAMLIYMQRTWNDLKASPTVSAALDSGIATPEQLMAAGYNSNPAKLPGYINRGGSNWTALIPRETKVYLQIFDSIERHVPMTARTR
ncbi:MAG TPA: hypothetical protein VJL58_07875 [Pyrinomonadaceae bacterium]|nr:hypothetical protein [Pyrinomonadaceae bacterium]